MSLSISGKKKENSREAIVKQEVHHKDIISTTSKICMCTGVEWARQKREGATAHSTIA
jgi:hypothetical protein